MSSEEIREKIIAEATEMFMKGGIENCEMKEIAQQVGIGRSTLYRYFPEKEQLAYVVLNDVVKEILIQCYTLPDTSLLNDKTGYEITEYSFRHMVDILMKNADVLHFMSEFDRLFDKGYPGEPETPSMWAGIESSVKITAKYIEQGQKDGSIAPLMPPFEMALTLGNAVIGISQRLLPRSEVYRQESGRSGYEIARMAVDMLLRSIKA